MGSRTAKRGNGEGSIYQRADGRWVGVAHVGYKNNRRVRKSFYGTTRREVVLKLSSALKMRQDGLPLASDRQTVATYLAEWLRGIDSVVKPKTLTTYEGLVRIHITPTLGRRVLSRLEPQHLQQLYGEKLNQGLSPQSVRHIHAVLHRALEQAARWGLIVRNVADLVSPPRAKRFEIQTLSPEQAKTMLHAIRGDSLEALYVLALTTGMRQGELLALHWRDVDLDRGLAQVRGTLSRTKTGFQITEPKTAGSRRQVSLGKFAVSALHSHRINQNAKRLLRGGFCEDRDLVFANETGRPLDATNLRHRSLKPLLKTTCDCGHRETEHETTCKQCNCSSFSSLPDIRFHDLRHSAATFLLAEGIHPKIVSEMLGHSRVNITLDLYSHVTPNMHRQAADAIDAILSSA